MPQFILKIDLGNDAMITAEEVSIQLDFAAMKILHAGDIMIYSIAPGVLRDINGNVVGHYEVVDT